jgi:hypothetical protein
MCAKITMILAIIGLIVVVCFSAIMFCVLCNAISYALWGKYIF